MQSDTKSVKQEDAELRSKQRTLSLTRRLAIGAMLFTYFALVIIWINPNGPLPTVLMPTITPIIHTFGIGQSWSVFSPDVRESNYHETALICFDDGLLKLYEFPRMQKMNYLERFRSEKFRKLFYDCMPWPDFKQFLPEFGKYVASANYCAANPPDFVALIHHSCRTPSPEVEPWIKRSDLPEHTFQTTYYLYKVQDKPLK
jgi:hypothetical protein